MQVPEGYEVFHLQFEYVLKGDLTAKILRPIGTEEDEIELTDREIEAISADANLLNLLEEDIDPWDYNAYRPKEDVPAHKFDIDLTGI